MKFNSRQYAQALFEELDKGDKKQAKEIMNSFVSLLVENNDVAKVNKILELFVEVWNKEKGIIETHISSARDLDKVTLKAIADNLKKISGAKEVEVTTEIKKELLGGVVINYEGKRVDASLRKKIDNLKLKMIK